MQYITRYQKDNDGTYSVVATGVELEQSHIDLLENGYPLKAEVEVPDNKKLSIEQRKLIFALCNDIEAHTGQPRDYMRQMFQDYVKVLYGYEERISLSNCSRTIAKQIIEAMFEWIFTNAIPLNYKTSKLMKEDKNYLYWATVTRHCIICGKPHADLAHYEAVGRGMNRNKMNHYDKHVLALCREHHNEQHAIGVKSFDDKYHLHDSWLKVDERLNKMLKGEKND
ncbi:TPA: putative HNHc nuclease [Staphylococcus aureus]